MYAGRKDMKQLVRKLRKAGGAAQLSPNGHYKLTHPDKPGVCVTCPSTASDFRAVRNTKACIKRELGIDI